MKLDEVSGESPNNPEVLRTEMIRSLEKTRMFKGVKMSTPTLVSSNKATVVMKFPDGVKYLIDITIQR